MQTIIVNGIICEVIGAFSCGPGCRPHTFVVRGGQSYEKLAGRWETAGGRSPDGRCIPYFDSGSSVDLDDSAYTVQSGAMVSA